MEPTHRLQYNKAIAFALGAMRLEKMCLMAPTQDEQTSIESTTADIHEGNGGNIQSRSDGIDVEGDGVGGGSFSSNSSNSTSDELLGRSDGGDFDE
ncbi:hypothetical protein BCR33DRAFT_713289 [Rhizoclosmatium globosum]|uniref:Uncharacterized protein n=1 Tax=Rhizoclosmatium globosum TaxID=329046 RepID=A0A1Y2CU32_9FUNG|nr:hypothetical protein BCR33DRAFT_713289 [Rhizoclosmatium globosum]|eukprot:ORY50502.1 hypothetical protein BCR33DRAFT_713289 [Rhizoclosmatium globosum]